MTATHSPLEQGPAPKLRADAERNRQRILEVGERVFAERGIHATLNDIAHAAGVGVGTVYRRYPDKSALIDELTEAKLQRVLDRVAQASTHQSGAAALRDLMMGAAALRAGDRGMFHILFTSGSPSAARDERITRLLHAWDDVIDRALAEGAVRPGFSAVDIDIFMLMVGAVADATHELDPLAWRRYAEVLIDGFAARDGQTTLDSLEFDDAQRRAIFLRG